jgi:peptidylprolyl isomerase
MNLKSISFIIMSMLIFSACTQLPEKKAPEEPIIEEAKDEAVKKTKLNHSQAYGELKLITLDSGLQYKILKKGSSEKSPSIGKKVTVHYAGWLEDKTKKDNKGTKFDSSVDRGEKFVFNIGIGQVIKGWDQGVMGMKVGEKRQLIVPYQLAYGQRGIPGIIPEESTLIFEVELFDAA